LNANESDLLRRLDSLLSGPDPPERCEPLAGDASTRTYYRAFYPDGRTAIVMVQPHAGRNEEASFLDVHRFLDGLGLPVPHVYSHDPDQGLIVLEDLGDDLLESVLADAEDLLFAELYEQAVDILIGMRRATQGRESGCRAFALAFDEEKLMEEMHFFMTHFVKGLCRTEPSGLARATLEEFFTRICTLLAAEPRVFAHRDYHARNLMLHRGRLVMVDFQDARMGPAQYDLASLLRDSYVSVPEDLANRLLERYCDAVERGRGHSFERFRHIFDVTSLQRNIKALGTFGYQLTVRGATRYLSAIPRTAAYVARTIARHPEFDGFRAAVEDHIVRPSLEFGSTMSQSEAKALDIDPPLR